MRALPCDPPSGLYRIASWTLPECSWPRLERQTLPFVDLTSNTPFCISRIEISKVPPSKSYTAITEFINIFTVLFQGLVERNDRKSWAALLKDGRPASQRWTQFFKRKFFAFFRSRGDFLLEITEDLILKCRSSTNEVFDSLGERNLIHSFLQLLGNDDEKDIDRFNRNVFNAYDGPRWRRWNSGMAAMGAVYATIVGASTVLLEGAGASTSSSYW